MSSTQPQKPNAETCRQAWDVLTTALEGGYAEEFEVLAYHRSSEDGVILSATVRCEDHEDQDGGHEWVLDERTIARGFARFTAWVKENDPAHRSYLGQQWAECHDPDDKDWAYLDAIGADAVLQFACFGEVIFG